MTYEVRHAESDDGEELLELWHGFTEHLSKYDERYRHKESANDRWLKYFENQLLNSKYGTVVVAEDADSGDLVGVLEARVRGNHPIFRLKNHGYINGHYVMEDHRNEGLGRRMVDVAHEWFAEDPREVDFYRVDVMHGDEDSAEFYRNQGFEPVEHVYERRVDEDA
ncbi:GNAT family N-acetyltransferase [Halopenitus persicus]|uniref:GNAT family N-acetyltransferase n=1 Tax=Halopenitus persicus TaxID=1048396 RepID=UPI000BBAF758|nr:GNAT family N-acetyltransferase [Halopenitus persicus]